MEKIVHFCAQIVMLRRLEEKNEIKITNLYGSSVQFFHAVKDKLGIPSEIILLDLSDVSITLMAYGNISFTSSM